MRKLVQVSGRNLGRYRANFIRCGLMLRESRIVADLLLRGLNPAEWRKAIMEDNLLAKRSLSTATSEATLIRRRLRTLPPRLWQEVQGGSRPAATQAVLAGVINDSPLFGDFLDLVLRGLYQRFEPTLAAHHWDRYVDDCRIRDPHMPAWSPSTLTKLRTRAFAMLAEAGYLSDSRGKALQSVYLYPEVARALADAGQYDTLSRLRVGTAGDAE